MSRPRVATVLSAREWEPRLVDTARRTSTVRVVQRAYEPGDLEREPAPDVVIAGSETAWITVGRVRALRSRGIRVVGVYPEGDTPGRQLLRAGGADATLPDTAAPEDLLQAAQSLTAALQAPRSPGCLIAVTGPRGAPGRTEVALAVAHSLAAGGRAVIVDLDTHAPSVAFRLGMKPGSNLLDRIDALRSGAVVGSVVAKSGHLAVLAGPTPIPAGSHEPSIVAELLDSALAEYASVIVDTGPWRADDAVIATSDAAVLVCDPQPLGLLRTAGVVREWDGPTPLLVLNRVPRHGRDQLVRSARRATGLEPAALIPRIPETGPPPTGLDRFISPLVADLQGRA